MNKLATLLGVTSLLLTACTVDMTDESSAPDGDEEVAGTAQSAVVQINNATITSLCVEVSNKTNAETSNAIELNYLTQSNDFWSCTLPSGAARGQTSCCTPTRTWKDNTDDSYEFFYVQFQSASSTDGLRVGGVSAHTDTGKTIHYGTFMKTSTSHLSMYDCDILGYCSSYSIDGDGSPDCWKSKLELDVAGDARAYCISN